MNHMCFVCNDPRHFQMKVDDCRRIANRLSRYAQGKHEINMRSELWHNLFMDRQHTHVMCGHCPRVNEQSLRTEEEKLRKIVYQICMQLEAGEKLPVRDILPFLAGYYPIMHREVYERIRRAN